MDAEAESEAKRRKVEPVEPQPVEPEPPAEGEPKKKKRRRGWEEAPEQTPVRAANRRWRVAESCNLPRIPGWEQAPEQDLCDNVPATPANSCNPTFGLPCSGVAIHSLRVADWCN